MPTTYAHYRFGQDVLNQLPTEIKEIIINNIDLYNYGVHGPDLLFYYRPLAYKNKIIATGRNIHHQSGSTFFKQAGEIIKNNKYDEAQLSYIYGYICHFALDIACHGYVNELVTDCQIPHSITEAEFDRYLLLKDGVTDDPAGYSPVTHLHPNMKNSKSMRPYYKPYLNISNRQLLKTQKTSIFCIGFITDNSRTKRYIRRRLMQLGGSYIGGLIMTSNPDSRCQESNLELEKRYNKAVNIAVRLITNFVDSTKSNIWDREYESTFDPLSTQEELKL